MNFFQPITCRKCGCKFSAAHSQGAPGGTDAPGYAFLAGGAALTLALFSFFVAWRFAAAHGFCTFLGFALVFGSGRAFFEIPEAYTLYRNWDGGKCPECGTENKFSIFSL